jgi:NAD(P)-dependent dehydrogenase (short-subunit alcohol dehydrogenase family)
MHKLTGQASKGIGPEKVVADIAGAGGRAVAVQGNVARSADVDRILRPGEEHLRNRWYLVNSAGIYRFGTIEEVTEEELHRQFDARARPAARDQDGRRPVWAGGRQRNQHRVGSQSLSDAGVSSPPRKAPWT